MVSYPEDIVRFIVNHKKETVPENVIEHEKLFILYTIGCAIGRYCMYLGKQFFSTVKRYLNPVRSSLIGGGGFFNFLGGDPNRES